MFELVLRNTFEDVDVSVLLEENLQNQESRAAGVKIDVDGGDDDVEDGRGTMMLLETEEKGNLFFVTVSINNIERNCSTTSTSAVKKF